MFVNVNTVRMWTNHTPPGRHSDTKVNHEYGVVRAWGQCVDKWVNVHANYSQPFCV